MTLPIKRQMQATLTPMEEEDPPHSLLTSCWNGVRQLYHTVMLCTQGFDHHAMQARVWSERTVVADYTVLPFIGLPPLYYFFHPAASEALQSEYREGALFTVADGEISIHRLIADMLQDPSIDKEALLFTCSKERAQKNRKIVGSYFHRNQIASRVPAICQGVKEAVDRWEREGRVNISKEAYRFTCDLMSRTILGQPDSEGELADAFQTFFTYIVDRFQGKKEIDEKKVWQATQTFWSAVDLESSLAAHLIQNGMSENEAKMTVFSVLFAGMDSSASATVYTLLKCAQERSVQDEMNDEIQRLGSIVSLDDALKCKRVVSVIIESLRMFCPVIGVTRIAKQPLKLTLTEGDKQQCRTFPKGAVLAPAPSIIARDPQIFPERPNEWRPERYDETEAAPLPLLPWRPFGSGKHLCPGWMHYEAQLLFLLIRLASRNTLQAEFSHEPGQCGHFINKLREEVWITFNPR